METGASDQQGKNETSIEKLWEYVETIAKSQDSLPQPNHLTEIDARSAQVSVDIHNVALFNRLSIGKKMNATKNDCFF